MTHRDLVLGDGGCGVQADALDLPADDETLDALLAADQGIDTAEGVPRLSHHPAK